MARFIRCFLLLTFFLPAVLYGQKASVDRVEPPFWWTEMRESKLQLMIHGSDLASAQVKVDYPGVKLQSFSSLGNPNYLFLNLNIDPETKPGKFDLIFSKKEKVVATYTYELKQRQKGSANRQGFNSSDVIYLVTPDRFANGDTKNDNVTGMKDTLNRADFNGRHGGDIQGMIDHLDYLKEMGFTALWLNPVLENNMTHTSYHGYAITDFYRVDPRYGTNEKYQELKRELEKRGMKLIMDMIFNHCGSEHWWLNDMPSTDWFNLYPNYQITNHRRTVNQDPHAASVDKKLMSDGWFVPSMPDLNQKNPFMANYLIQNAIWWTEFLGLEGIRMDTYPYPDKDMMAQWTKRMLEEYPHLNIVGEEWSLNPAIISYWQKGKWNSDGYVSYLPSLMDFPLNNMLVTGLNEKEDWSTGLIKIYESLSNDFLYPNASNLVIFPDNHDMSRIYTQLNENDQLMNLAVAFYLTTRGIPQFLYGTEILMSNKETIEHGVIRSDFPGGWSGDPVNAFTGQGLNEKQKEMQAYFKKILNWRKTNTAVQSGQLKHYAPQEGVYVYFRYNDNQSVMVILNKNDEQKTLETKRFGESLLGVQSGYEVLSGQTLSGLATINIPAKTAMIIELK